MCRSKTKKAWMHSKAPKQKGNGACVSSNKHKTLNTNVTIMSNGCRRKREDEKEAGVSKTNHPSGRSLWPSGHTAMQHNPGSRSMFSHRLVAGGFLTVVNEAVREHRCPLWWHRLLTELTPSALSQTTVERPTAIWEVVLW